MYEYLARRAINPWHALLGSETHGHVGNVSRWVWFTRLIQRRHLTLLPSSVSKCKALAMGLKMCHQSMTSLLVSETHGHAGNVSRWVWFTRLIQRRHLTLLPSSVSFKRWTIRNLWPWASRRAINPWHALSGSETHGHAGNVSMWVRFTRLTQRRHLTLLPSSVSINQEM